MSTRRDKFTNKDRYFMNLALNLAKERVGLTGTNPSVGCVITKDDRIINIGQTGINGRPHAEFHAIMSSKKKLKGSTLYSSLEPCTHYGKTPPCTNLIIKAKIKKVIFSILDADKRTYSKSFKVLKSKKIIVKSGLLKKNGNNIYKDYIYCKLKKMPFVTGKIAVSKDNFIYSKKKLRITNGHSDEITHLLRYQNDSILISSKTLNSDNPKLNCRIKGLQKFSPKRIILDRMLSISFNSNIILTNKKNNTIIFYNKGNKKKNYEIKKKRCQINKTSCQK